MRLPIVGQRRSERDAPVMEEVSRGEVARESIRSERPLAHRVRILFRVWARETRINNTS